MPAPASGLYSQDDPATLARQVEQAAGAGIDGFVVSWSGSGQLGQTTTNHDLNHRLALLVSAVAAHNRTASHPFGLMLRYEGLDNARNPRPTTWVRNDLAYFAQTYATSPEFRIRAYGSKPVVMFLDSRKFSIPALHTIVDPVRARLTRIGDEHGVAEWDRGASSVFDGDGWYWSDENPYANTHARSRFSTRCRARCTPSTSSGSVRSAPATTSQTLARVEPVSPATGSKPFGACTPATRSRPRTDGC